jgi:hypothetical protein
VLVALAALAAVAAMPLIPAVADAAWTTQPTVGAEGRVESSLVGVSCASAGFCMAVGAAENRLAEGGAQTDIEPLAERWTGIAWTAAAASGSPGASPALYAISCTSPSFCVAVGSTVASSAGGFAAGGWQSSSPGEALVEAWNGSTWTVQATPAGALAHTELSGVSCTSSTSCVAVGSRGVGRYRQYALVETWNGTSWSERAASSPGKYATWLTAISCVAGNWCTAVGAVANTYIDGPPGTGIPFAQPLAESWNGSRWVKSPLPGVPIETATGSKHEQSSAGTATGVSCKSRSFCLASGYFQETQGAGSPEAFAGRWNGRSWTNAVSGLSRFGRIDGVSCQSSSACVAAGTAWAGPDATSRSKPLVADWNHSRWSSVSLPPTPAASGLAGVSCVPSAGCTAVGEQPSGIYQVPLAQSDLSATSSSTPVTVTGPGGPRSTGGALAAPVLGHTANLELASGSVLVKLPGSSTFAALTAVGQIPFGTVVDATHGSVSVTTAGLHGTTQTVTLSEGEFVLSQGHSGMVVATLAGGDFSACPTAQERAHIARATSKHQTGKHVVRKLWAEGHGNFTTDGNYASASVRGTKWLTEDLCEGTLIHVATDRVAVINRITHRHLIVKAGHSYLAKAP